MSDCLQAIADHLNAGPLGSPDGLNEAAGQFAEHVHGEHGASGTYEMVPLASAPDAAGTTTEGEAD